MLIVAVRACQAAGATKLSGVNAESNSADGIMMNERQNATPHKRTDEAWLWLCGDRD